MPSDRITVKALRPTESLRTALRDFARERDVDFVAVETLAAGPQVVLVKTACGIERLEGEVTREQVEAAIAKCDAAAKPVEKPEDEKAPEAPPKETPKEDEDVAVREEGAAAPAATPATPAEAPAAEPKPDA